jgi:hypothetical protein
MDPAERAATAPAGKLRKAGTLTGLQLRSIATANRPRPSITPLSPHLRLSTPLSTGHRLGATAVELNLPRPRTAGVKLPRPRTASAVLSGLSAPLSGFTDERNLYMSRCLDLLEPKGASAGSGFLGHHDLELQQKRRAAEIDKAFSEISGLIKSKGQESKREQKAAAAAAAAAADKVAEERRETKDSKEAAKEEAAKAKPAKRSRTASSRVQAKMDAVRADAEGAAKLAAQVEAWRKTRSDGQVERRDFIRENRDKAHAASAASIVSRRSELFVLERQKTAEVRASSSGGKGVVVAEVKG